MHILKEFELVLANSISEIIGISSDLILTIISEVSGIPGLLII